MRKKAQSLSLNTIVIAILVIIVLVVLVFIFKEGISNAFVGMSDCKAHGECADSGNQCANKDYPIKVRLSDNSCESEVKYCCISEKAGGA